jgi:predicted GNAT family acetyltransferase
MSVEVTDNRDESRYEIRSDGELAGFVLYRLEPDRITFIHTEIEPRFAGAGLGGRIARAALDDARARSLSVVPQCPFIAGYIRRHPEEYLDLVPPALRAGLTAGD